MPFTVVCGFIPGTLQIFGEERQSLRQGSLIVYNLVRMGIKPGQNRSAAGRRERCRDESILHVGAFRRHSVHIGSLKPWYRIHEPHIIESVVVGEYEYYVTRFFAVFGEFQIRFSRSGDGTAAGC